MRLREPEAGLRLRIERRSGEARPSLSVMERDGRIFGVIDERTLRRRRHGPALVLQSGGR